MQLSAVSRQARLFGGPGAALIIFAGRRHFRLAPGNIANFIGRRGQRGRKLPRGFQNVDAVTVEPAGPAPAPEPPPSPGEAQPPESDSMGIVD